MDTRVIIKMIKDATMSKLTSMFSYEKIDDLYCEINSIKFEYFEDDYDDEFCTVKVRCGRYVENGKNNFDVEFTIENISGKSYEYICGMVDVLLSQKLN